MTAQDNAGLRATGALVSQSPDRLPIEALCVRLFKPAQEVSGDAGAVLDGLAQSSGFPRCHLDDQAPTTLTITAGTATKLVFTSTAVSGSSSSNANLGPITVERQDAFGNPAAPGSGITVALSSTTPAAGSAIFATSLNGTSVTSVTIPAGASSVNFYYGYSRNNQHPTITVSSGGLTPASQDAST